MAPLKDPETLAAYKGVLSNWELSNCIVLEQQPQEFARAELGIPARRIRERMFTAFVVDSGEIDVQVAKADQFKNRYPLRYDLRFSINKQRLYAETTLDIANDPFYSTIRVVKLKYEDDKLNRQCSVRT